MTDFTALYAQILTENGLSDFASGEYAEEFEILYKMLVETNEKFNLTAITDQREVILRHFADSLTAAKLIGGAKSVLDVGCGGGFPVLPLAIARPDVFFTALDSTAKKLTFVERVAYELALPVHTLAARAEEIGVDPAHREGYDLVISRAVARMNILCELCLPFVRVGGQFIAMKGSDGMSELDEARSAIEKLGGKVRSTHPLTLGDAGGRVLIEIEKIAPTPKNYPRQFGRIKKKPL